MQSIEDIKTLVYEARIKFIEKKVIKAITDRDTFVEIPQNYITKEIKAEMEENGYTVESKILDPDMIVVSWN